MSTTDEPSHHLTANHERRVTATCRHIDKLLADMEEALHVSSSLQAFPQYISDVTPQRAKAVEDGIASIRAHLVHVLEAHNIERPVASVPVSRYLHTVLGFITIAAEELKPRYMRGYGALSPEGEKDLRLIADELLQAVSELDAYVRTLRANTAGMESELDNDIGHNDERTNKTC